MNCINATNDITINDDENFINKYYAPFILSNNHKDISLLDQNMISENRILCRHKNIILDLLLKKSNSFKWQVLLLCFLLNNKKISSHMDPIIEI